MRWRKPPERARNHRSRASPVTVGSGRSRELNVLQVRRLPVGLRFAATPQVEFDADLNYVDFDNGGDDTGLVYNINKSWIDDASSYVIGGAILLQPLAASRDTPRNPLRRCLFTLPLSANQR